MPRNLSVLFSAIASARPIVKWKKTFTNVHITVKLATSRNSWLPRISL